MLIEELKNNLHSFKAVEAAERERLESRLANYVEKAIDDRGAQLVGIISKNMWDNCPLNMFSSTSII